MLRTTALRTVCISNTAILRASPCLALTSCRTIMTSTTRGNLTSPKAEAVSTSPHAKTMKENMPKHLVPSSVLGDWVLHHPVYSSEELQSVDVLHRGAITFKDKLAINLVKVCKIGFDFFSRYKNKPMPENHNMTLTELREGGYVLDESNWMIRILFLESIAGVPGMVAATLRHLKSMRLLKRDSGWIHTLLEEAENERMHLLTFMTIRNPGIFLRTIILGAQGVMYNLFFLSYMLSPSTCHRFVGYLEEEAVSTYTRCILDLEEGRLPEWENMEAPVIAKDYWHLAPNAKMIDVLYAVRSDETTHRFVNHSLANLNSNTDVNPFALREPSMDIKGKQIEFKRSESEQYVLESQRMVSEAQKAESSHPSS